MDHPHGRPGYLPGSRKKAIASLATDNLLQTPDHGCRRVVRTAPSALIRFWEGKRKQETLPNKTKRKQQQQRQQQKKIVDNKILKKKSPKLSKRLLHPFHGISIRPVMKR